MLRFTLSARSFQLEVGSLTRLIQGDLWHRRRNSLYMDQDPLCPQRSRCFNYPGEAQIKVKLQ